MTKKTSILIGFILLKFLMQYILYNPIYDLQRDEYLHLDQANHLAWGFQSLPPVTSWIAFIIKILGNGVFWIKFFPALFGALTIWLAWKTIEELKGNLYALILGATCLLLSALVRLNFLFQPNSLDILCWTAFYFVLIKYINSQNVKWLYAGSLVFALGFLNKYNIAFLLIGLFPAVLLTYHRKVFAKKEFYFALALGMLLILPNLIWQYQNEFPVFHHLKELAAKQLVNVSRIDFLKEQSYFFIGALPAILASLYAFLFYAPYKKFRLFFWSLIFTLAAFTWFKAKSYYAVGLYPIYISFGVVFLGNVLSAGRARFLKPVLLAIPIVLYILLFDKVFSIKSPDYILQRESAYRDLGLLRWEDGKNHALPQDFADMLGWQELAEKVDDAHNELPNKQHTLILCDNYGQAGAINYYSKNKKISALSFNADYINWFTFETDIYNLIRVKEYNDADEELIRTTPYFLTGSKADSVENPLAREYRTTIFVFSNPKTDITKRVKADIENEKSFRE